MSGMFQAAVGSSSTAVGGLSRMSGVMAQAAGEDVSSVGGSAAVLASGDDYVRAGIRAADELGELAERREARIRDLAGSGGSQERIAAEREQVSLLQQLRARVLESVERVSDILLGGSERERAAADAGERMERQARRMRQLERLEESAHSLRLQLPAQVMNPAGAARAYGAARADGLG